MTAADRDPPASEGEAPVAVEHGPGGTTRVELRRAHRANALDEATVESLAAAVEAARHDGTRMLVLTGAGRHFCAGFDMADALDRSVGDLLLRFVHVEQMLRAVRRAPYTTVAHVRGSAVGAGADLVAACSHRLLDPGARLRFPGFGFGVALGTRHLAAVIGEGPARDVIASGRRVEAEEAMSLGLATGLVAPDGLEEALAAIERAQSPLDSASMALLRRRTTGADTEREDDADLAALVRSVVRPGLHTRLARYLESR